MSLPLPQTMLPDAHAAVYEPDPASAWRVRLAFRVDFTNGGHLEGEGFLLDLPGSTVYGARPRCWSLP